jgi:ribulose-5-phosphate 4-epimerase/fuculose-1-phosphate aldolase
LQSFSVLVEGDAERYLINPFGLQWSQIRPHHLLLIDGEGSVIEGEGEVEATALYIHVAGHRANPRHRAILHVHMPHATALTMVEGGRLEMAHQTAVRYYNRMTHLRFGGVALGRDEGERIAEARLSPANTDAIDRFAAQDHTQTNGARNSASV